MEGPRGHRGTYREPAIVNLVAGDDSGCSLDPLLPIEGSGRWAWRVLRSGCGREFDRYRTGERQFIKVHESQLSDHER